MFTIHCRTFNPNTFLVKLQITPPLKRMKFELMIISLLGLIEPFPVGSKKLKGNFKRYSDSESFSCVSVRQVTVQSVEEKTH